MRRDLTRLAAAAALGGALVAAWTTFRIWSVGSVDAGRPAGAIVVMGAAQYNGQPSPVFRARLDHAVSLYQRGLAPLFVVTGGRGRPTDTTTEAEVARAYAIARGVPEDAILVEDGGRTTLESLRTVGTMLREHGVRSAVFVSDRPHMLRVLLMARDQGLVAHGSPTTTSPAESSVLDRVADTIHEIGGLGLYFLTGTDP